jgi:hypothetical protein
MNEAKLQAFMRRLVTDVGGAAMMANVILGDELGLCRAMADDRPVTPEERALALAVEGSPVDVAGGAGVLASLFIDQDKIAATMRGDGAHGPSVEQARQRAAAEVAERVRFRQATAQAGERRLHRVFHEAGSRHFRRATETPFNLVLRAEAGAARRSQLGWYASRT